MPTKGLHLLRALAAGLAVLGLTLTTAPAASSIDPAAIQGQVLSWMDPLGFARVTVFDATTGSAIRSATADGEGNYLIGGLPPRPVKVRATKSGYLDAWASGASTRATADVYTLQPGQTLHQTWDADMVLYLDLTPEAVIRGSIMGFSADWDDPLNGVRVTAFDASTGRALGSATTGDDWTGDFVIGKLPAGRVKLRMAKSGWLTGWAYDRWTRATADVFTVQPLAVTDVGTVGMYKAASIQGSVMLDSEPIARDVTVTVFDADTGRALRSVVDDDGYFRIDGLLPVRVKVRASGPFYTTAWANWQTTRAAATVFQLRSGEVLGATGSDGPYLDVVSAASIQGQVLGDFDPLGYARVTVYDAVTGVALRAGTADADGYYRIDRIPVGFAGRDVKVRGSKDGWRSSWANGTSSRATADTFHLVGGQVLQQSWDPMVLYLDLTRVTPAS